MRTLASLVAAGAACAGAAWAVRGRSSQVFGPSRWRGSRDHRTIALTFDDGPSAITPRLLDVLARYNVPATFFQCGANVDRLPSVAREVHAAGHEIGNHSYSHPYLFLRSPARIEEEIARAQSAIGEHTGATPEFFRAPYGVRWFGVAEAQRRLGLHGVMWTIIGYDWSLTADAVVKRIATRVSNGAILCLHDGRELQAGPDIGATLDAVERLVPMLLDQGYKFETVSRILCPTI